MAKSFDQLYMERAHKDSLERVGKPEFKAETRALREEYRERGLYGTWGGRPRTADERLMKRNAKQGKKNVGKVGMKATSGPCFVTKYDSNGNVVDKSVHFVKA